MEKRILEIQEMLDKNEGALITSAPSRFYVTGFSSSAGTVFITRDSVTFFIDFRYYEKAKSSVNHMNVVLAENTYTQISKLIEKENIACIFVENDNITVSEYNEYSKMLGVRISKKNKLCDTLKKLRCIKSKYEIDCIKTAQSFTDATFSYILDRIKVGVSERDIMLDMEFFMRKAGSEGIAFDFIVVSGKHSSLPHGVPTDKPIEKGDFITMDFGAIYKGYMSDMTRTVAVGDVNDKQKEVYYTVLEAQNKAFEMIKPDTECYKIDKAARDYIYSHGYEGCFGHGLGHSVGIEIHEMPSFSPRCKSLLKVGTVMTVEPGIYLENEFGVRIEDMVYITEDGFENLTHSTKELIQI